MKFIKPIFWFVTGAVLFWLAFKNLPLNELLNTLANANYWLLLPVFIVTLLGYIMRVQRWRLLTKTVGLSLPFGTALAALSVGYLVSFVLPRAGEVTRCLIPQQKHKLSFAQLFVTVLVERAIDTFVLLLLVLFATFAYGQITAHFFIENILLPIKSKIPALWLVVLIVVVAILFVFIANWWLKRNAKQGWENTATSTLKKLLLVKPKWLFLLYTFLVWVGYFLMTYIWVFAFNQSNDLPLWQIFVVMIVGTIGKSVPIQGGGIGAYHYLVSQAFVMFGVSFLTGNALAIIIHGAQTVFTLTSGTFAYLYLLWQKPLYENS